MWHATAIHMYVAYKCNNVVPWYMIFSWCMDFIETTLMYQLWQAVRVLSEGFQVGTECRFDRCLHLPKDFISHARRPAGTVIVVAVSILKL